jgi:iron-sulfur cluster assembly protein
MIDPQTTAPTPERLADVQSTPLVVLSEAAAGKLRELTEAEANPQVGLRVYVYSGGCSGFRYGMMLEDQPTSDDVTVETRGIKVYVDRNSTQYLTGSEIDYLDTLMGAGFTVNNPNAVSGCGCGSSFRTAESAGNPGACHH